ncbi:hypothetical protein K7X08_020047 [Anisodus acutangulus]|uniref:Uncharacterized protein n=1 Tax=Anisodus acutangulus TaxID=402998 RepID=A0A9Q1REL1_9SOLA|nr:hypothetical protein K7X08_020047 [Anisodus acutangulus]
MTYFPTTLHRTWSESTELLIIISTKFGIKQSHSKYLSFIGGCFWTSFISLEPEIMQMLTHRIELIVFAGISLKLKVCNMLWWKDRLHIAFERPWVLLLELTISISLLDLLLATGGTSRLKIMCIN